jgi:hypothetical protein
MRSRNRNEPNAPAGSESDHRQREDEALVLRRQHQIDEHQHDPEDVHGLVAAPRLVVREALPGDVVAARQVAATSLIAWTASPVV